MSTHEYVVLPRDRENGRRADKPWRIFRRELQPGCKWESLMDFPSPFHADEAVAKFKKADRFRALKEAEAEGFENRQK